MKLATFPIKILKVLQGQLENPIKMAKCIMELERIKGISHGGSRESSGQNDHLKSSQSDLAEEIGINQRQIRRYKELLKLMPELQDMVEDGKMKASIGYNIWAKMPQDLMIVSGHQRVRACKHNILKVVKILILFII